MTSGTLRWMALLGFLLAVGASDILSQDQPLQEVAQSPLAGEEGHVAPEEPADLLEAVVDGDSHRGGTIQKLIDPVPNKVNIHFRVPTEAETVQRQDDDVIAVTYDAVRFHCSLPPSQNPLQSSHPIPPPQSQPLFPRSEKMSPLSLEEMAATSLHFASLKARCHFDMVNTLGSPYLYQLCFGMGTLRRGDAVTVSENEQSGTVQLTWENVVTLANATAEDRGWWGYVENDPVALDQTGYSSYFYQYYEDSVVIKHLCADQFKYLSIDEAARGFFVVAYGSPLACTHPNLQRIRAYSQSIECFLDPESTSVAYTEIEGSWTIFDSGEQRYQGTVEITQFQYFQWGDVATTFPDRASAFAVPAPQLYLIQWDLGGQESYSGMGLHYDTHLCTGWDPESDEEAPGVSTYRFSADGSSLDAYWWSPDGYGMEEMTRIGDRSSSPLSKFSGVWSSVRTIDSEEEPISQYGTVTIDYAQSTGVHRLFWAIKGAGSFAGQGILSNDHLCVTWRSRTKRSDGTVSYLFEGDRANGKWTLAAGTQKLRTENLIRTRR